jgi:hypothetical protein
MNTQRIKQVFGCLPSRDCLHVFAQMNAIARTVSTRALLGLILLVALAYPAVEPYGVQASSNGNGFLSGVGSKIQSGGEFAAEAAIAYVGFKDFRKQTRVPHSPPEKPDVISEDGTEIWKDGGDIKCIKMPNGPVFRLEYDGDKLYRRVKKVIEPDGSYIVRKGKHDEWDRMRLDKTVIPVYGQVVIKETGEIRYLAANGSETIFASNGQMIEIEDSIFLKRFVDTDGHTTEFHYDFDGKLIWLKCPDGSTLEIDETGHWNRRYAEDIASKPEPYEIKREDGGVVVVTTPDNKITYSQEGKKVQPILGRSSRPGMQVVGSGIMTDLYRPRYDEYLRLHPKAKLKDIAIALQLVPPNASESQLADAISNLQDPTVTADEPLYVRLVLKGSPADRAGIMPGDRILEIDGTSVFGLYNSVVRKLLRGSGEEGSHILLTMERANGNQQHADRLTFDLVRAKFIVPADLPPHQ